MVKSDPFVTMGNLQSGGGVKIVVSGTYTVEGVIVCSLFVSFGLVWAMLIWSEGEQTRAHAL